MFTPDDMAAAKTMARNFHISHTKEGKGEEVKACLESKDGRALYTQVTMDTFNKFMALTDERVPPRPFQFYELVVHELAKLYGLEMV